MSPETREDILNFDLPNPFLQAPQSIVDYELCVGTGELRQTLLEINRTGAAFLCATQDGEVYTVFFRRRV